MNEQDLIPIMTGTKRSNLIELMLNPYKNAIAGFDYYFDFVTGNVTIFYQGMSREIYRFTDRNEMEHMMDEVDAFIDYVNTHSSELKKFNHLKGLYEEK